MRHDEAWTRLPDLLEDRDDPTLLAHVRSCADCQRQLFLLGRVDRMLRDSGSARNERRQRRFGARPIVAGTAVAAAATAAIAVGLLAHQGRTDAVTFRTASGKAVGYATVGHPEAGNVSLGLVARGLPVDRGRGFVLWADDDTRSPMQVGRFMVDRSGACRVRFNLPASHRWRQFRITLAGSPTAIVAST